MKNQTLSSEELENVLKFEGYGTKSAPYWFLGMEEGGGTIEELRLRAKSFNQVEDLSSALKKLGREDTLRRHVPTWRVMSKLIMAILGKAGWQDASSARDYQATELGRSDGDTFLTELMPLPARGIAVWPYEALFPTKSDYLDKVRPSRIKWLRDEISVFKPHVVICYGKGNWRNHKEIFNDVVFRSELDGKIWVGQSQQSTVLLLPFLSYDLVTTALMAEIADFLEAKHKRD